MCAKLLQSCLTLCVAMDCSLPGSSVHGILQARIVPCLPSEDLPDPEIKLASLMSPALAGAFFTTSATWKAQDHHTSSLICLTQVNLDAKSAVFKKEGSGIK